MGHENQVRTHRCGVLVTNLGTPEKPQRRYVARFLRQFLSDPRVVDLPRWLWLPLLNLVIIPLRAARSAAAYRKIWWEKGSPLLILTLGLGDKLARRMSNMCAVVTAMRYGKPSIQSGLSELRQAGADKVVVLPLFPQFSYTTTASVHDAVDAALIKLDWAPEVKRIDDYHNHPAWVDAVANSINQFRQKTGVGELLLFSLHGIPQRYVRNGDPYEQQCKDGVTAIATSAGLKDDEWMLTFQSRVGREPWLMPYTDITLQELAEKGLRHVQVICPGFAVDCLETLEEIALQNFELFEEAGGERLDYIPCLNDEEEHAQVLQQIIEEHLQAD
jgi:ferrochelatase